MVAADQVSTRAICVCLRYLTSTHLVERSVKDAEFLGLHDPFSQLWRIYTC